MRIFYKALWAVALAAPGAAQAKSLVLDFEFGYVDPQPALDAAYAEGIIIDDPNYSSYGVEPDRITIGNDGFFRTASITARPGYVFDVLTTDIVTAFADLISIDCTNTPIVHTYFGTDTCDQNTRFIDWQMEDYETISDPPMEILGYRSGSIVAQALVEPVAGQVLDIAALGDFTDLDMLTFTLDLPDLGGGETFDAARNRWLDCAGGGCGVIQIDNLALNVTGPSQVPLPAGGFLLIPALAALRGLRKRR